MSLERFVQMFTAAVPDATADEIADILWLATRSPACPDTPPADLPRSTDGGRPGAQRLEDLAPAFSDLRRAASAPGPAVFDEYATAERAARGIRLPVLRPATERWLDLALIIDASSSMEIWRDTVHDYRAVLESAGVFRQVRVWWLDTDTRTGESFLLRNQELPRQAVAHSPWELVDPTRRQVILVISDCLGTAWRDRRMARLLERWAGTNQVSVVQLFPQRLWRRCAPPVSSVQIWADRPTVENRRFAVRYRHVGRSRCGLPPRLR